MMLEELKIIETDISSPTRHGLATIIAFIVAGFLPLLPYVLGAGTLAQFSVSIVATAGALFVVGSSRSLVTSRAWIGSGLEMLFIGSIAAAVAFGVGAAVKAIFGISV